MITFKNLLSSLPLFLADGIFFFWKSTGKFTTSELKCFFTALISVMGDF